MQCYFIQMVDDLWSVGKIEGKLKMVVERYWNGYMFGLYNFECEEEYLSRYIDSYDLYDDSESDSEEESDDDDCCCGHCDFHDYYDSDNDFDQWGCDSDCCHENDDDDPDFDAYY